MSLQPTKVSKDYFPDNFRTSRSLIDTNLQRVWLAVLEPAGNVWLTWTGPGAPQWQSNQTVGVVSNVVSHDLIMTPLGAVLLCLTKSGDLVALQLAALTKPAVIPTPSGVTFETIAAVVRRNSNGDTMLVASASGGAGLELYERKISLASWPPGMGADWESMGDGFTAPPALVEGTNEVWVFAPGTDILYYKMYHWFGLWGKTWWTLDAPNIIGCFANFAEMVNGDRYIAVLANTLDKTSTHRGLMTWHQVAPSGSLALSQTSDDIARIESKPVAIGNMLAGCECHSGQIHVCTYYVKEGWAWATSFYTQFFSNYRDVDLVWCPEDFSNVNKAGYLCSISDMATQQDHQTIIAIIGTFGIIGEDAGAAGARAAPPGGETA